MVKAWDVLKNTPLRLDVDSWLPRVSEWIEEGLEVGFNQNGNIVEIFAGGSNPLISGNKIGEIFEEAGEQQLRIFTDGTVPVQSPSLGSVVNSKVIDIPVVRPCGDPMVNASLIKTSDGAVGILDDLSDYAPGIIRDALTRPNEKLRYILLQNSLVRAGEQAHHVIPVELLQKNAIVQDAVEAGFDFNGIINGKGLRSTGGSPIHRGSHKKYTDGVQELIAERVNPIIQAGDYSPSRAKSILEDLSTDLKELMDEFPDKPVNTLFD